MKNPGRNRIPYEPKKLIDEDAYTENACSKNAKKIEVFKEDLNVEFWIDKHYSIRDQHGDEFGKRDGIGIEVVQELVACGFRHLLYYSTKYNFQFINHPPPKQRNIRIVLQSAKALDQTLNVVVEYHFISLNIYEVTVITAMCKDGYTLQDGQYALEFHEENSSILYFSKLKSMETIGEYQE